MTKLAIEDAILKLDELCPLPVVGTRVMALCGSDDATFTQVAAEIATDAALTVEVLKVANSAVYGTGERLADVGKAVARIGLAQLQHMVSALVMLSAYTTKSKVSVGLHHRSLLSGEICRRVAEEIPRANTDQAFIAGLLCEVGAMACLVVDEDEYARIRERADNDVPLCEQLETARYGFTCRALGAALLRKNGLPDSVADAIGADPSHDDLSFLGCAVMFSRWSAGALIRNVRESDPLALGRELRVLAIRARFKANRDALVDICTQAGARAHKKIQRSA